MIRVVVKRFVAALRRVLTVRRGRAAAVVMLYLSIIKARDSFFALRNVFWAALYRVPALVMAILAFGSTMALGQSSSGMGHLWRALLYEVPYYGVDPDSACQAAMARMGSPWGYAGLGPLQSNGNTQSCLASNPNAPGSNYAYATAVKLYDQCVDGYALQPDGSCKASPLPAPVQACAVAHPVIPGTGTKILVERNGGDSTELPIVFAYRSQGVYGSTGGAGQWTLNWQRRLSVGFPTYLSQQVTALRDDGSGVAFVKNGGSWAAQGTHDTLKQSTDATGNPIAWQYTVFDTNLVETYDGGGKLQSVRDRNGRDTTLTYNSQNRLTRVTAPSGRSLTFAYDAQGRISSITAPDGAVTQYAYNANGMLTTVTWPDNTTRQYVYEDTRFPTALTGVIDEAGVRYATYAYDDQGRAITSELTAGADRYQFQYQANGQTTVLTPDGGSSVYSFLKQNGVLLPTGVSAPCPTCGNTALSTSYDSNNNATSKTGYDGSTTSYTYDTLGRETQRIEGAGTANAKTTTTEWDPQQWLVTRVAAPNKIEAFSYDANGNLLSHTVTPTGDANGSQGFAAVASGDANRIEWTYDSNGNVLTTVEKNGTATIATWTFTYDAQGNLLTLTNPEGKTGKVTQYDAAGRVVAATDVDGRSIQYGYNARGWLVDHYIGDVHIHYDYDAIGNRTAIYRQGSQVMSYVYDAAHRLIDIIDKVTAPSTTVQAQTASPTLKSATLDASEEPRTSIFDAAKDWMVRVRDTVLGWIRSMLFALVKSAHAQVAPIPGGTTGYGPPGPIPQGSQPMHALPRADQTLDGNYDPVRLRPELGALVLMAKAQQACSAAVQTVVQVFSKSTPPGDCDQNGYEKLKKNVDSTCKPEPSRCSPGDAQADILRKLDIRTRCADARRKIMDTCFRGGDLAHISKWLFETAEANICKGFVQ